VLRLYLSVFVGVVTAIWVFNRLVSGKSTVRLSNWRGMIVLYLMGMGSIWTVQFILTLVLGD
jgi:hypothetical protein